MRSAMPKPLHKMCGRPMLLHVLGSLTGLNVDRVVVVVGHMHERVVKGVGEAGLPALPVHFVEQRLQRGTGDAVAVGLTAFDVMDLDEGDVIVLPGDAPLLRPETLSSLLWAHRSEGNAATLLVARLDDPTGYGRVVHGRDGRVARVVEQADATAEQREVDLVNTSVYCFRRSVLAPALRRVSPLNSAQEYYLTDVVQVLYEAGHRVGSLEAGDATEVLGVNDLAQLAEAEAICQRRTNAEWMRNGVTMLGPEQVRLDVSVRLYPDVTLAAGTSLEGATIVRSGASIGPGCRLVHCLVGERARLEQVSATNARIGPDAVVGPYAVLAPGSEVPAGTVTGPFFLAGGFSGAGFSGGGFSGGGEPWGTGQPPPPAAGGRPGGGKAGWS